MGTSLIKTTDIKYSGHRTSKITEQEIKFCNFILKGMTGVKSVFEAGYYPKEQIDDKDVNRRARVKANSLLNKICIREYINKNRRTIYLDNDNCDRRALKVHIYQIAMGNVTQNSFDKDGNQVDIPPSFKDQVSAAALFFKMDNEDRQAKINSVDIIPSTVSEEIGAKVNKFISRFNNKEIAENNSVDRLVRKGIIEAEYKNVDRAIDNFIEEETKID